MKKHLNKIISIILIATLLFNATPYPKIDAKNLAAENSREEALASQKIYDDAAKFNPDPVTDPAPIIGEIIEKRTANTKSFRNDDNSVTVATYPYAVHYLEEGTFKEINNTLIPQSQGAEGEVTYRNSGNSVRVSFAENVLRSSLLTVEEGAYRVSFSLKENDKTNSSLTKKEMSKTSVAEAADLTKVQKDNNKKMEVEHTQDGVVYKDVKKNIDLEYILQGADVKENIIIKGKTIDASMSFDLNTENLAVALDDQGNIQLKDLKTGDLKFVIPKPFMYDDNGETSDAVELKLERISDTQVVIRYVPDEAWLNAKGRAYPVVVDPPILSSNSITDIHDTFVDSADYSDKWQNILLRAGTSSIGGTRRSFIHVDLPSISSGDMVISAKYCFYTYGYSTTGTNVVKAHQNTSPPNNGTYQWTNWNNQPSYDSRVLDYQTVSTGEYTWKDFDVTEAAKEWYQNGNNYGIALEADDSPTGSNAVFRSSDTSNASIRPSLLIQYINTTGIEGWQTYHTQSIGRAGTGYVNDYTGDLTIERPILTERGELNPLTVTAYYNGNNKDWNRGYGNGWSLNVAQYMAWYPGSLFFDNQERYMYCDADGTKHYYKNIDGVFKEEDASTESTLTFNNDANLRHQITDKNKNKLFFDSNGYLTRIEDKNGNQINIELIDGNKPLKAVSSTGNTTNFVWSNGQLQYITDSRNKRYDFNYSNGETGLLTSIEDPDGATGQYYYNGNGVITDAASSTGGSYSYAYSAGAPYRVTGIYEKSSYGGSLGSSMTIAYGFNTTIFTDQAGKKMTYQYNNMGQCTGVVDDEDNAIFNNYGSQGNSNNLVKQSKTEQTIVNLLQNNGFETIISGMLDRWFYSSGNNGGAGNGVVETSSANVHTGPNSFKITKTNTTDKSTLTQWVRVEKGKTYTLSGYVKTDNLSTNGKANLQVVYADSTGKWAKREVSDSISGTSEWNRPFVSFTVPADAASDKVWVELTLEGGTGTAWFDDIQLEEGNTPNRYNLVQNSALLADGGVGSYFGSDGAVVKGIEAGREGRNAVYMIGNPSAQGRLWQDLNVKGAKGDSYVYGAWAKADSVPVTPEGTDGIKRFTLEVQITYADTTTEWISYKNFNTNYGDWQYLAFPFVAKHDYTNIRIYASYSYNANKADFADFHVYKDDFGASFTYDSKGNVTSVKDKSAQETAFQYDDYNNLNQVTNSDGGLYKYTYTEGDVKNLLTATSAEGIKYSYEYTPSGTGRVAKNTIVGTDANGNEVTDKIISNILAYTDNDNYTATKEDSKGYEITNTWDTSLGRLTSVSDNVGGQVSYGYDISGRVTQTTTKMNATQDVVNQSVFTADKLTQIIHNGFSYNFTYDSFGHRTGTAVGSTTLVSDTYNNQTHLLTSSTYGNGTTFEPVYNGDYQMTGKKYDGTLAYEYIYGNMGELTGVKDNINNLRTSFIYDLSGRLVNSKDSQGNSWTYGYDTNNKMNSLNKSQYGVEEKESITFDKDNKVTSFTLSQGTAEKLKQTVTYDKLGRMTTIGTALNGSSTPSPFLAKGYEFMQGAGGAGTTTTLVSKETVGGTEKNYTYDAKGNILSISSSAGTITYTYDLISQLTKETNGITGETIDYVYDTGGNILSKTITKDGVSRSYNYGYNDTNWKDKLTSFDGQNILYDQIGNPLSLNGATLGWTQGRKLSTYTKDGTTAYYTYDENGIRKSKYVNGVTTEYLTSGGEVVAQKTGSNVTTYTRGTDGSLISMNRNGTIYYYQTNLQGDVEKILDGNGTAVVSYTYDAYGRITSMTGDQSLGQENPFRYRSYFFDQESGFYYLQSRYYDPMMGRFISADDRLVENGNMFSYCSNNPVMNVDKDGHRPKFLNRIINYFSKSLKKTLGYFSDYISVSAEINVDFSYSTGKVPVSQGVYGKITNKGKVDLHLGNSEKLINIFQSSRNGGILNNIQISINNTDITFSLSKSGIGLAGLTRSTNNNNGNSFSIFYDVNNLSEASVILDIKSLSNMNDVSAHVVEGELGANLIDGAIIAGGIVALTLMYENLTIPSSLTETITNAAF